MDSHPLIYEFYIHNVDEKENDDSEEVDEQENIDEQEKDDAKHLLP